MTSSATSIRHRATRRGAMSRVAQRGAALRGVVVATGLVAAVALQLAGPRLQDRLAAIAGITRTPCVTATATANAGHSAAVAMHPRKVAVAISSGPAPAI